MIGERRKLVFDNKNLIAILGGLVVLAVILLVVIVIVNKVDNSDTEYETSEQYIENVMSRPENWAHRRGNEIADVYASGKRDEALTMFADEINKALDNGEDDFAMDFVKIRSIVMEEASDCEGLDKMYADVLSHDLNDDSLLVVYYQAQNDYERCGDLDKASIYKNKEDEIFDKDEYKDEEDDENF